MSQVSSRNQQASIPEQAREAAGHRKNRAVQPPRNISENERLLSGVGGAVLLLAGLARGKLGGLVMGVCGGALAYRAWTGHCHCYDALGIDRSQRDTVPAVPAQQGVKIDKSIAVNRPPEQLYRFWRKFDNLPGVMRHVRRIETTDSNRSHWIANAPLGQPVKWDAEIITEREPEVIAWRSLPGGDVETAGSVRFEPLDQERGTTVSVSLKYNPPGGKVVASLASLFGHGLEQELDADLRRFKSAMEAGEVPATEQQPTGT